MEEVNGVRDGEIRERIKAALVNLSDVSYRRLVLVVGPFGTGKTEALKQLAEERGCPFIDVSLELSRALLELSRRDRCFAASRLVEEMVERKGSSEVVLDNLAMLFEPSLALEPLHLLRNLSRRITVVAAWDGVIREGHLLYAEAGHPEYRSYPCPVSDVAIVNLEEQ